MSRCFPFPPPGYEKKAGSDDVDILKKEKEKEKKHKKEKKDKEKREDKEKGEKDRSDGKQRDKKDKKEKHKEKREKDRDKNKEKSSASDEKRLSGQAKFDNGGDKVSGKRKLPGQSKHIDGDKGLDGWKFGEKSDEGNGGEVCTQKGKERNVDKNSVSNDKKIAGQLSGHNGQKLIQNSTFSHQPKESKFVRELGKKASDEDRNQFFEKLPGTDAKRDEGLVRLVAKASGNWVEEKEKNRQDDDRKLDGQGIRDEARFIGSVQSVSGTFLARIDGMPGPLEKDVEKKMEGRYQIKQKETDDKHEDKQKDKEKDKVRDKNKKKEKKAKKKSEHKKKDSVKLKESSMPDVVGNHTVKTSHLLKESTNSAVVEVNIKKRKDSDMNGFLHANDITPNKLPRHAYTLPLSAENGRMMGTCQISTSVIKGRQEGGYSEKVVNKEHLINGLKEAQAPSISSTTEPLPISLTKSLTKSSDSCAQTDQIAEVSRKQPHPDSKYLPDVLAVPKMEDCSDFEDQEWLFQSANSQAKKPKVGLSGVDETPMVWSEALQIETVDVYALPYVIPY